MGLFVHHRSRRRHFRASAVHREKKAWGEEHWIVNKEYCGKKLVLKKDRRCSMHHHEEKDEVFYVQSGKVLLELDGEKFTLMPGDFVHVPAGAPHRFTGLLDSEIIEFSTTHKEDDSYRSAFSGHVEQERYDRQAALVQSFTGKRVLVIGDAMLDTYLTGAVERISPEAPIPVVRYRSRRSVPGGAANAASNVASLGGRATLLCVLGNDEGATELRGLLKKNGVACDAIVDKQRPTTEKQRIVSVGGQQIVRLDKESDTALSAAFERKILARAKALIRKNDAVLLSDYAKGVLSAYVMEECVAMAKRAGVSVIIDPKPRPELTLKSLAGATVITPNRKEAAAFTRAGRSATPESMANALSKITKGAVLLTLGGEGMLLRADGKSVRFPALAKEVSDVSGAGDTVAATVCLALACQASLSDAVDLSNRAASVVVSKQGTAIVTPEELLQTL